MVVEYADELSEAVTRRVSLARWGSRVFEHWYATLKRGGHTGPTGTRSGGEGTEIWIEQSTRSLQFALACQLVGPEAVANTFSTHQVGFQLNPGRSCTFRLHIAAVTSEEAPDPLAAARQIVREARERGVDALREQHQERWSDFWGRSFINIPDDYLENLWYFNLYQVGSSSQGRYPPHFIGSLWSWTRDARPWNHYYHWNQQQYVWPLLASGHPELLEPYARWRLEGLPRAQEDARSVHGCTGAFYSDVANRRGYQDVVDPDSIPPSSETGWLKRYVVLLNYNLTPGAQIAHDLYRHYEYTGDETFLRTYTYPILREWVRFMLDYLRLEEDGRYHVPKSDPYEMGQEYGAGSERCADTTNTLAYVRLLFPVVAELTDLFPEDQPLAQRALEVLENLADYVYAELPAELLATTGAPPGTEMIAAGRYLALDQPLLGMFKMGDFHASSHAFNAQLTPLFPTGLVGLHHPESREFQAVANALRYTPRGVPGHDMDAIAAARLGWGEKAVDILRSLVEACQYFPQGLGCYLARGPNPRAEDHSPAEHLNRVCTNRVKVLGVEPAEYLHLPTEPFSHVGLEPMSLLQTTLNEMLLQSYRGRIHVFPAVPPGWEARFTLHAVGGFVVTSERKSGEVQYLVIESRAGRECRIVNPWSLGTAVRVQDYPSGNEILQATTSEIRFPTERGHVYVVEQEGRSGISREPLRLSGTPNQEVKRAGRAQIGKPRQF